MDSDLTADIVQYALTLPLGHVLRDIAERTVIELSRQNPFDRPVSKYKKIENKIYYRGRGTECRNMVTGEVYASITKAAASIGVNDSTLRSDMAYQRFVYNIVPV